MINVPSLIAQLVEQSAVNRSVVGSSPTQGARWRVGQAVKTPPFHGGFMGSNPIRVTILFRAISSAGRAPALQAGCRQFDPVIAHHFVVNEFLFGEARFFVGKISGEAAAAIE